MPISRNHTRLISRVVEMKTFHFMALALFAVLSCFIMTPARAEYPTRQITIIVPVAAGGPSDVAARLVAEHLRIAFNQPVIVDNRPGASSIIGSQAVAKSDPDGYTLLLGAITHAANPALFKTLPYDPVKDFTPITEVIRFPIVVEVPGASKAKTLSDLVAMAKQHPKSLNAGSAGAGASQRLVSAAFEAAADITFQYVTYKGTSAIVPDLLNNTLDLSFTDVVSSLPYFKTGELRPLAVTSAQRMALLPDVPTIAESGYPGFEAYQWYGLFAPGGTPADIVAKIQKEIASYLQQPETVKRLEKIGAMPVGSDPKTFSAFVASETAHWRAIVKEFGLSAENQ